MTGIIATIPRFQFNGQDGNPLLGGTLTTQLAGTTTNTATWQDQELTIANTNPIVLDAAGGCIIWLSDALRYKFTLRNSVGVVQWTQDNINGATSADQIAAPSGSSLVGYLPAGSGAVATTVQGKLRDSVSVTDFIPEGTVTSTTNCSPFFQAAIDHAAGGEIRVPSGTYRFLSGLTYSTVGLGNSTGLKLRGNGKYKTIFKNETGGALITCTSGAALEFQYGAMLASFAITNPTGSINTIGIAFVGIFQSEIFDVRITQQTSRGITMVSSTGDATDCSQVRVHECDISSNTGDFGILISGDLSAINSTIQVDRCRVVSNTGIGIAFYSAINCSITNTAIAYNTGIGVVVGHIGGPYSKSVTIHNNEFDSNTGTQLLLDQIVGCSGVENYFICNNASPIVTKQIDITTNAREVSLEHTLPRLPSGYTGVTMYTVAAGAAGVRILNTAWSSWEAAGNTKYTDASTNTFILDANEYLTPVRANLGIKFPSVYVPSANANTLDDYELGDWTATLTGSVNFTGTPTFSLGRYIKIGRSVTIEGAWSGTTAATSVTSITMSLPFAAIASDIASVGHAVEVNSYSLGFVMDSSAGDSSNVIMVFPSVVAAAGRILRFSYTYLTA